MCLVFNPEITGFTPKKIGGVHRISIILIVSGKGATAKTAKCAMFKIPKSHSMKYLLAYRDFPIGI